MTTGQTCREANHQSYTWHLRTMEPCGFPTFMTQVPAGRSQHTPSGTGSVFRCLWYRVLDPGITSSSKFFNRLEKYYLSRVFRVTIYKYEEPGRLTVCWRNWNYLRKETTLLLSVYETTFSRSVACYLRLWL